MSDKALDNTGASGNKVADAKAPTAPQGRVRLGGYLSPRAIIQVFLTFLAFATSITAFIFCIYFRKMLLYDLMENIEDSLKSEILPCLRKILTDAGSGKNCAGQDTCWYYCCPTGYNCQISPTVGLMCQSGETKCGGGEESKREWCRDYVDIPDSCKTEVCQKKSMVMGATLPCFLLSGAGACLDVIDVVLYFAAPDSVTWKACFNLASSLVKWMAFGVILGAGTQEFMADLYSKQCYNQEGMTTVALVGECLVAFVVIEVISALISLILAPISAYYGGKLIGVPYVKTNAAA